MKVLFIGGTGLISEAVSKLAVESGIELYLFNRGQRTDAIPQGAHVITGDIRDAKAAKEILKNYSFDVVVDWVAFTPEQVKVDLRSEEHTSELQSRPHLVCRLLLEKKN